jgi:hypothetical protein
VSGQLVNAEVYPQAGHQRESWQLSAAYGRVAGGGSGIDAGNGEDKLMRELVAEQFERVFVDRAGDA